MAELLGAQPLATLADASRLDQLLPMLVAVQGRITTPEPAKCELTGSSAVIRTMMEEEVYLKEGAGGRVNQEVFELRTERELREAYLEDVSGSIRVESLSEAEGLRDVMVTKQAFKPADQQHQQTLLHHVLIKALKPMIKFGTRTTERHLPLNTSVTLVGELVPDTLASPHNLIHTGGTQADPSTGQTQHQTRPRVAASADGGGNEGGGQAALGGGGEAAQAAERRESGGAAGASGREATSALAGAAVAVGSDLLGQAVAAAGAAAVRALPYVLRMPQRGPFLVTQGTLQHLLTSLATRNRHLRTAGYGFGILGTVLVVRKVVQQLWALREHRRVQRLLAEADAARRKRAAQRAAEAASSGAGGGGERSGGGGSGGGATEAEEGVRGAGTCVVCLDRDTEVVFSACGHMCACYACSTALSRCPICRVPSRMIRVYRP